MSPAPAAWLAATCLLAAAGASFADCKALYPAERVAEQLADTRYQRCEAVALDYADLLAEQGALLASLRPAYRRQLGLSDEEAADGHARQRLRQYDDNLRKLMQAAAAVRTFPSAAAAAAAPTAPSAPSAASLASDAPAAVSGDRAAARLRLKECRALSQALSDRITAGQAEFQADEITTYCKHDFLFRISGGLHGKLARCLEGD